MNAARERILAKPKIEEVEVPEWGKVRIQALTARQRVEFSRMVRAEDPDLVPKVAAWALVDEQGKRLFDDEDVNLLADADGAPLEAVVMKVWRISGLLPREDADPPGKPGSAESPS